MEDQTMADLYKRKRGEVGTLHARAAEIHELTKRLEELPKDTSAWYASMRARVEARAALEQVQEPRRVLEELGERLGSAEL